MEKNLNQTALLLCEPEIEMAKDHLRKAISINKNYAKAYYKLGLLLVDNKDYKDAMKNFESAISNDKNFAEAHYQIALLLMNDKASKILSKTKSRSKKS